MNERVVKIVSLFSVLIAFALPALAASSKDVIYKSGDETVHAVLYTPSGQGPFPGIVVIHEWFGLVPWVQEQATKLADQGYVALAIDLYRGKVANSPEEAHELMRGVPEDRAQRDLDAAFHYLQSLPNVKKNKIGAIGWCMGGGYALDLAIEEPELAANVINYGHLATDPATLKKINAPILGLFGAQDRGIRPEDVKQFETQMKELGKTVDITIYPDAGHQFENPNNQAAYRAADADDAWNKTVNFLASTLQR
jgi:carboxymethylenebutenolidase